MLGSRKRVQLKSVADRLRLDSTVQVIQSVLHFRNPRSVQPDADMTVALGASISVSRSELRWLGQLTPL